MQKIILCCIICFVAVFCVAFKLTKTSNNSNANNVNTDSLIEATLLKMPNNTQLSIGIMQNNEINFLGFVKKDDKIEKVDNRNAIFEIGSVTKTFTAALLSYCINNNLLTYNTTIGEELNIKMPNDVAKITLQQLANHTSGLPRLPTNLDLTDISNPYNEYDTATLYQFLQKAKLENIAGKAYSYSNTGAGLLALICCKKLKINFEQAIENIVFKNLSMTSSYSNKPKSNNVLVKGLNAEGEETSNWDFNDALAGAGAIKSNMVDMMKYAKAQLDSTNKLFSLCHASTFKINDRMSIGLAWHLIKSKKGNDILFHNGGTAGYTSSFMAIPSKQKAVVILSNVSAFNNKMSLIDVVCASLVEK